MATKNKYYYPIDLRKVKISYESPAHTKQFREGRLKYAVDFIAPEGTPIKAALEGIVIHVKDDSDMGGPDESFDKYGNYVEIKHANEEYSIYEHIKKGSSKFKVGDKVKRGQIIALSGATGWLAHLGPHLHFDVHKYFAPYGSEDYESLEIVFVKK
jgi:murein DD-endopeptidase MepM/ murein hydrolase activator NlpD